MMKQVTDLSEVPKTGGRCKGYLDDLLGNVLYKLLLPVLFSYSRLIITLIFKERFPLTVQKHIRLNQAKVAKSLSLSIFICL